MRKVLLLICIISPVLLWAQGSQVNTQSQKSVGMSGAGSAFYIDETSIFYNPGALAKMSSNAVSLGTSGIMYRSAFQEVGSDITHETAFKISPPVSLFAAFGPKDSWWKAGIGIYNPFGGNVDWGTEWPGRYSLTHLSMRAFYIQPTLSFRVTENFSIGGGFVYNIGMVDLAKALPYSFPDGSEGHVNLKGTGSGMGYNLGVHYHLEDEISISLNYRSKVNTKLEGGDATFSVPSALSSSIPAENKFDAELPLPSTFTLGLALPLNEKVNIAADASIINYTIYKELGFKFKENGELLDNVSDKKYQNAFSLRGGVDIQTNEKLALRAGAGFVYSPVQKQYVYPETPDNNRYMGSIGFTYSFNPNWDLNAAYVMQYVLPRTAQNVVTKLNGRYATYIHAPGISLTYKW
ncbi:MAG TPA: outer membrane protein transport protein [Candidatus Sphingobacterium stercoripullorum]|nr:outer membrane protein transport protein [Candidatus Sphingobacterium stercoripullorum]